MSCCLLSELVLRRHTYDKQKIKIEQKYHAMEIENLNPNVYKKSDDRKSGANDWDDSIDDPFDAREIFGMLIRSIEIVPPFIQ